MKKAWIFTALSLVCLMVACSRPRIIIGQPTPPKTKQIKIPTQPTPQINK